MRFIALLRPGVLAVLALSAALSIACQGTVPVRQPEPLPTPPEVPRPEPTSNEALPRFRWEPLRYTVSLRVRTEELATGERDSLETRALLSILPDSTQHVVRASLVTDSAPALPGSGFTIPVTPDGAFEPPSSQGSCEPRSPILSPLFLRYLLVRAATDWPHTDSLRYDTCLQGVRSSVTASFTWALPHFDPRAGTHSQDLRITGSLSADSTRTLPLKLAGSLHGSGKLEIDHATGRVRAAQLDLEVTLTGRTTDREQRITQRLAFHVPAP